MIKDSAGNLRRMNAAMAGTCVIGAIRVVKALHRLVRRGLKKSGKMVPHQSCDAAQFETAGTVVHDAAQEGKEKILRYGGSINAGITCEGPHSSVRQAVYQPKNEPANRQLPDRVVVTIAIDRFQRRKYAGDVW
jgi:hypothetical protein